MKRKFKGFVGLLESCLLLAAAHVCAQDKEAVDYPHEPLVVYITGSNIPAPKNIEPGTVEIISREDIERSGSNSITQLLQNVSGLFVENSMYRGGISSVYLRGAEANYTLVLIDGVKVNDPTGSRGDAFDFSTLDLDMVEQIEIVKGPASSVYGSSALAGVVNIITNQIAGNFIHTSIGSNKHNSATIKTSLPFKKAWISLDATYSHDGEQVEGSRYQGKSISASGRFKVSRFTEIISTARLSDLDSNAFPEASGGGKYAVLRELDDRKLNNNQASLALHHEFSNSDAIRLSFSHFRNREEILSPGIAFAFPANNSDSKYDISDFMGSYQGNVFKKLSYSLGIQFQREDGSSRGELDLGSSVVPSSFNLDRNLTAAFMEMNYAVMKHFNMFVGIRVDDPDGFDSQASPSLGLDLQYKSTQYKINWGKGFKLPSFFALGHPLVGNPNFKPETSESLQFEFKLDLTATHDFNLSLFDSRYFDLIDFGDAGILVTRPEVRIKGVELRDRVRFMEVFTLQSNITLMDINLINSNELLNKRPELLANIQIGWEPKRQFGITGRISHVGKQHDFSFPTGDQTLNSYTRADIGVVWRTFKYFQLKFSIDNLLDKRYQESVGTEVTGRFYKLSLQSEY